MFRKLIANIQQLVLLDAPPLKPDPAVVDVKCQQIELHNRLLAAETYEHMQYMFANSKSDDNSVATWEDDGGAFLVDNGSKHHNNLPDGTGNFIKPNRGSY
jgi:hypothetical protein